MGPRLSVQVAIGHGRADTFWLLAASLLRSLRRAAPHVAGVSHRPYKVSNGDFKAQHHQQKPGQREHVEEAIGSLLLAWWHRREGQLSVSRLGPGVVNIDPCFWHPVVLCLHKEGTARACVGPFSSWHPGCPSSDSVRDSRPCRLSPKCPESQKAFISTQLYKLMPSAHRASPSSISSPM